MGEILVKKEKNSSNYFHSCLRSLKEHIRVLCWDLCCLNLLLNDLEKVMEGAMANFICLWINIKCDAH